MKVIVNSGQESPVKKIFFKYVLQNILGMIGISFYILADTYFISKAVGAKGITALNLVLPVYSVIFAIGAMIGVGSAIRFSITRNRSEKQDGYFFNAIFFAAVIGFIFILTGILAPDKVVALLGGDEEIVAIGTSYTRIFMMFAPFFMWNHICNAFVRNDGAPGIAMSATLISSLFNVVFDYVLMFPCKMGMEGAALATALSPLVGVGICCIHFFSKKNTVPLRPVRPSVKMLVRSCQLGIAAFVGEISSGIITVAFNIIILGMAGNIGVAAYGVVANVALVAIAVFNGVSQGSQPLLSRYYGQGDKKSVNETLKYSIGTSFFMSVLLIAVIYVFANPITELFNSENISMLTDYAVKGLRLYSIGFVFAGINIVGSGALSAIEAATWAFVVSITRGFVAILVCAVIMSALFGMTGVWLAFPAAELITLFLTITALVKKMRGK